ncbi:MAG: DoxX family protein [Saprospiraceae bacterium]|nr:DoxX family protein [Saprospiraceae bacterium]
MSIGDKLDSIHLRARKIKWLHYFAIFCRISLAIGFIPPGIQKILGQRFTELSVHHPMGNFLEAFHHTGYYYPFVGYMQVLAGILLLIPRTVTLGAFIYLPIILNICVLSFAVRFEGSIVTSPLMVCAVVFLLCWNFHRFKNIFPFKYSTANTVLPDRSEWTNKFPTAFFASVFATIVLVISHATVFYDIMPRNTKADCMSQCDGENDIHCLNFCDCIHERGKPLKDCLEEYEKNK